MPRCQGEVKPRTDWIRVHLARLAVLLEDVPARRRWAWRKVVGPGERVRLQVVSPRGAVWDFKLAGGAWLRRAKAEESVQHED